MAVTDRASWAAVGLATASVPLHAWMLLSHGHGAALTGLMAALALWCLWCAAGVGRALLAPPRAVSAERPLRHLWVMAAVMAGLHLVLLTGVPGHHTHAAGPVDAGPASGGGALMLGVLVLELAVCFACALALRTGTARPAHDVVQIERN